MAASEFAVIFKGRLVDGVDPAAVRANLAKLFNADAARIEKMFSGQTVIIKKGLDEAAAQKYRAALGKAGAVVEIVAAGAPAKAPAEVPAAAAVTPTADAASAETTAPATPQRAASAAPQTVPRAFSDAQAPPDPLAADVAEPGATLVEAAPPAAPDIATDHLSMAEPGVTLVEPESIPEPAYDLSAMSLDPPGVTLVEPRKIAPPEYDLSGMSLDEPS